ncbi:hypothetical protein DFP96_101404 [Listeria rocourtiae]|uniref:Uncharacterized protein n=1 Tax=Listeria rocourtiae TaxID=647910 RepID=A0A4R6ZRZ3_9LIST|nr:hypothetical protein DFP96_101404 [Listeria rocourtiae]
MGAFVKVLGGEDIKNNDRFIVAFGAMSTI